MILHITRHGQILPSAGGDAGDGGPPDLDPRLSSLGRRQASLLGRRLRDAGFGGPVYASPFLRAAETAQIVAETVDSEVILAPPLRESNGGGGLMDHFIGAMGPWLQAEFPRIRAGENLAFPWWTTDPETPGDVEARVGPLVEELEDRGREALLVGHAASVGAATRYLLNKYAPGLLGEPRFSWNCMLTSFILLPDFRCLELASTDHLPNDSMTSNGKTRAEVMKILGRKDE